MKAHMLAAAAWLLAALPAAAQVDTSGVDQFWRAADRIAAGETLSAADWDAFFAHPGYRVTQQAGQRRVVIEFCMRAVFAPGGDVAAALANRPQPQRRAELYATTCAHMAEARAQRGAIDAMLASGVVDEMLSDGLAAAANWLPSGATQSRQAPRVYALLFEPQGFGRSDAIVIDALYVMQRPTDQNAHFIGHEFHHSFRDSHRRLTWAEGAEPLMQQLDRIVHEGTASMVDKAAHIRAGTIPHGYDETLHTLTRETPQRLAQIDAVLAALTPTAEGYTAAAEAVDEANPWGGHLNGVFMAMTIEDAFGRQAVIGAFREPIAFFEAYQRAARARGGFTFSDAAMANLRRAATP